MDKTQQMKMELENYRANKVLGSSKPDIKTELENYRASKITQAEAPQETPSFGTSVARGILKTPARLATNLINAGQIALGQEQTQPFSGKFLGEVKPVGTEGTFGQRLKESVGAGLELASYIPMTKGVSSIAKATLGQKVLRGAGAGLKEGAIGGAVGEFGRATSEGANLEEATVKGLGGGLAGGVLGGAIGGVAPLVAKGLGFKPKINVQEVKDEVVKNTSKALGVFGKKPVKMAQAQPQKMAEGLAVLKKYGGFDPKVSEDIFDDSIKGLIKAKETVFKTYDDIARESGDQGLRIEVSSLTKPLEKYIKGITTSPKRSRAIRIMSELDRNFPDGKATPVQIQEYIKLLNEELGGLAGGAEKGAVGVVSDFVKNTTDTLDNEISKLGSQYKSFRKEYAGLKSIEDALVRQYQKAMRQKGSGLAEYSDMFANAELINGLITANPGLVAKSLTMRGISSLIKRGNNPETYLRKAFEGLDQIGDEMLPKTTRGVPQLMLPAPKKGTPQSQVFIPKLQPTRQMIQQGTEIVPRNSTKLPKTPPKLNSPKSATKSIDPLINEAKKYKSAEEFVNKADITKTPEFKKWAGNNRTLEVYHGSPYEFSSFKSPEKTFNVSRQPTSGISFSDDPKLAERFKYQIPENIQTKNKEIMKKYIDLVESTKSRMLFTDKSILDKIEKKFNVNLGNSISYDELSSIRDFVGNRELKNAINSDDFSKINDFLNSKELLELEKLKQSEFDAVSALQPKGKLYRVYIKAQDIKEIDGGVGFGSHRNEIVDNLKDGEILKINMADTGGYIGTEYIVKNPKDIFIVNAGKTKSQLEEIWKKANSKANKK